MHLVSMRDGQRGWAGILVLLLAVVVIAFVAQRMVRAYGLATPATAEVPRNGDTRARDAVNVGPVDATTATPVPAAAIEKARGVEASIQQQADQAAKRIDEQTR